ncbi:hypothetical protein PoB_003108100 [Plakobranchus ocellatus]|uniref:Uncharacterized protein n=1 Tax=Plakobranchus ocellatus TaxID=259542 RepID=A0AAV4AD45_9GAST|nr:hypothetical protein PoB_003108100 [Plakobranchus ocellatus]
MTPPSSGMRRSYLMMSVFPISMTLTKQVITYKVCRGVTLYQSFEQKRNTLLLADRARHVMSATAVCSHCGQRKRRFCMFCPSAGRWPMTAPKGGLIRPQTKSSGVVIELPCRGSQNNTKVPPASHAVNRRLGCSVYYRTKAENQPEK